MIRIEDNFEDVLGKAMRGKGLSIAELAERTELSDDLVSDLLGGNYDSSAANRVADMLNLNGDCLHELANSAKAPSVELPDGIILHNTPFPVPGYEEMTVNSYSVLPRNESDAGYLIDAGSAFDSVLCSSDGVDKNNWTLLITHTHPDHIANIDRLSRKVSTLYTPELEHLPNTKQVKEGEVIGGSRWEITALETPGHSPGGTSYLFELAGVPVLFVGDALFCYSIGKVSRGYDDALQCIRRKILSLPKETILCPGHGPLTTVGFEMVHNPFFAS